MIARRVILLLVGVVMTTAGAAGAEPRLHGMPEALQGMPPKATEAAAEIQDLVARQRGLIEKARQAKTPEEREDVFRAVAGNVQAIARERVVVLEEYDQRARARVEWARKHASEVRVSDLTGAMRELAKQGPRSPFASEPNTGEPNAPKSADDPPHAKLPEKVLDARSRLKQTLGRLESLAQDCKQARTDAQRKKIKEEIHEHLKTIEEARIDILEAILDTSEQRLGEAKKRTRAANAPAAIHESRNEIPNGQGRPLPRRPRPRTLT